ncbi:MAG: nucleoside monophosphate kinase [Candidatus Cloacimonetes bacterium]|nr:nucleoside monophosphate kinase [Candidatus Cloacimonadota bacterium]
MECYVFFGIQGSGKGTQAKLLSERTGFQHVNIGDLLREQVALGTELGKQVSGTIGLGDLVMDEIVYKLVGDSFCEGCKGIVFDGFPRNMAQAEYLVKHFEVKHVFFLRLDQEKAIERISSRRVCASCGLNYNLVSGAPSRKGICDDCGGKLVVRDDDKPAAIARRFKKFYKRTLALREFFQIRGLLSEVDASLEIDEVSAAINSIVDTETGNR